MTQLMGKIFTRMFNLKVIVLLVFAFIFYLYTCGYLQPLDLFIYDFLLQQRNGLFGTKYIMGPKGTPPPKIYILAKDDHSYAILGEDWNREIWAKAIRELNARGTKVIGVDLIFAEEMDPEGDQMLTEALEDGGNVILAQRSGETSQIIGGHEIEETFLEKPIEKFEQASAGLGSVNTAYDNDNILRQYYSSSYYPPEDIDYPNLATKVAATYLGGEEKIPDYATVFMVNFIGSVESIPYIPVVRAYFGELDNPFVRVTDEQLERTGLKVQLISAGDKSLSGVVVDINGNPVENADVMCFNLYGYGTFVTKSDPSGKFRFTGLFSGIEYTLAASTRDPDSLLAKQIAYYGSPTPIPVDLDQVNETQVQIRAFDRLQVEDVSPGENGPLTVTAYLADLNGMPVAGEDVRLTWTDQQTGQIMTRRGKTGEGGDIVFERLPQELLWLVVSPGSEKESLFMVYGPALSPEVASNDLFLTTGITLSEALPLEGVIIGEKGQEVAGAEVFMTVPVGDAFSVQKTVSDEKGRFRFTHLGEFSQVYLWVSKLNEGGDRELKAGWYGLGDLDDNGILIAPGSVIIPADRNIANAALRLFPVSPPPLPALLPEEGSISGVVVDDNGKPLSGIPVLAYYTMLPLEGYPGLILVKEVMSDENGNFTIDKLPPGHYYLSASVQDSSGNIKLFASTETIDPEWDLDGAVVFIGPTSPVDQDLWPVPTTRLSEEQMAGVEYHAHAFHSLVTDSCILRPFHGFIPMIIFPFLGLVLVWTFNRLHFLTGLLAAVITVLLIGTSSLAVLTFFHRLIYTSPLILLTLLMFSAVYGFRFIEEQREKMRVRETFKRFVSPEVVNKILATSGDIRMGGERREMTVFFSDVRSFTTFSEHHTPEQIVECLNEYLNAMAEVIFKYEGTLDKFVGDEIMAVWGAPLPQPNHAELALRCCIEQGKVLEALWAKWEGEGREIMDMGMGLNTGPMITGAMGADRFMDYTVIGDAVNLGARLEGLTRDWDNYLIISEFTYEHVKDIVVAKPLEPVVVKGKTKPVMIYEIQGLKEEEYRFPLPRVAKKEKREAAEKKKASLGGGSPKKKEETPPAADKK